MSTHWVRPAKVSLTSMYVTAVFFALAGLLLSIILGLAGIWLALCAFAVGGSFGIWVLLKRGRIELGRRLFWQITFIGGVLLGHVSAWFVGLGIATHPAWDEQTRTTMWITLAVAFVAPVAAALARYLSQDGLAEGLREALLVNEQEYETLRRLEGRSPKKPGRTRSGLALISMLIQTLSVLIVIGSTFLRGLNSSGTVAFLLASLVALGGWLITLGALLVAIRIAQGERSFGHPMRYDDVSG